MIRQLVSKAITTEGQVIDVFTAAGLAAGLVVLVSVAERLVLGRMGTAR